jgi:hypothetical protein
MRGVIQGMFGTSLLFATAAEAIPVDHMQTTTYSYSYFAPGWNAGISGAYGPNGLAYISDGSGPEALAIEFGLYFPGGDRDLNGYRFTYDGASFSGGDMEFWLNPLVDWGTPLAAGSFVQFGDGNSIEAWSIIGSSDHGLLFFEFKSAATVLDLGPDAASNAELLNGTGVYSSIIWEGSQESSGYHDISYATDRGRWERSVDHYCETPEGETIPCPNAPQAIASLSLVSAPVPLPGVLLLSGLGLLFGATLRRPARG